MKFFTFIITLLFVNLAISNESNELVLATYNAPPYQYAEGEVIKGVTVSTVQCIFHKLEKDISLDFYPLKRALRELAKNNISGVFPVHSHGEKGLGMQISSPISIEKWYWLSNFPLENVNDFTALKNKLIGAVNGSPAHEWLLEQKITVGVVITSREQLLKMFLAGRVDAIIIDDNEAHRDVRFHQMIEPINHYWQFIKFESHHFSFSKNIITTNPKLMDEFNENISSCTPLSLQLSLNEKRILQNYLAGFLTQISEYLSTSEPIMKLSEKFLISDVKSIDEQWVNEANKQKGLLYDYVKDSPLSLFLTKLQNSSQSAITEIIVIDTDGYAIGVSKVTTDLYQGDEFQFLNTFPSGPNSVYVSDIKYDASTQLFQTQVSFTLPEENAIVGVVTFGLNVEEVISYSTRINNKYIAVKDE